MGNVDIHPDVGQYALLAYSPASHQLVGPQRLRWCMVPLFGMVCHQGASLAGVHLPLSGRQNAKKYYVVLGYV